ncbi:MAG: hypothetical protein IMW89_15310 [Ktedonobacteraceae bacterium]|nr:hypothetical protein [Ktedonobacteraceae bacterium]
MIALTSGLYAWYRLPDCEIPLRLPFWLGRVEDHSQENKIVHVRPTIPGYEHEVEEVHLTQVVAWLEIPLDNGNVNEESLASPHLSAVTKMAEQQAQEKGERTWVFCVKSR